MVKPMYIDSFTMAISNYDDSELTSGKDHQIRVRISILFTDLNYNLLALARVKLRTNDVINGLIKETETSQNNQGKSYNDIKSLTTDEEELEYLAVQQFRSLARYRDRFEDLELEKSVLHKGILISAYSLLEDTIFQFTIIIKEYMNINVTIEEVCKRDKGIFKYLKYLEAGCGVDLNNLKQSPLYNEIYRWNRLRNQFVHVGDYVKDDNQVLLDDMDKLNVSKNNRNKVLLSAENIDQLLSKIDLFICEVVRACWIKNGIKIIETEYI